MINKTKLVKFLATLTICVEEGEPVFEQIIESEIKVLDAVYYQMEEAICDRYKSNYKVQQKHLNKMYAKRSKDRNRIRLRYDKFIECAKGITDGLKDANDSDREVYENITDLFRNYISNIKID